MTLERNFNQLDTVAERLTEQKIKRDLLPAYRDSLKEIRNKISVLYEKYAQDGQLSMADVSKYNRLANLEKDIAKELKSLGARQRASTKRVIGEVYEESYYRTAFGVEREAQAKLRFGKLPKKQVEAAVTGPVVWQDSVQDHLNQIHRQVKRDITSGIIQGKSYPDVAKDISRRMGVGAKKAQTIARTECHRSREIGKKESLEHAYDQGVHASKVWVSTLDDVTRDSHQELDGQKVPVKDEEGNPGLFVSPDTGAEAPGPGQFGVAGEDINCRCTSRGEIEGYEPEVRRSREDGVIPQTTYPEYAKEKGWPTRYDGPEPRGNRVPPEREAAKL